MTEREAFQAGIAENPLDDLRRNVFADWLLEHDEPEEAERQRKYVPALIRLLEVGDHCWQERDDEKYRAEDRFDVDRDLPEFLDRVQTWTTRAQEGDLIVDFDHHDSRNPPYPEMLDDLEAVTGEKIVNRAYIEYGCSC